VGTCSQDRLSEKFDVLLDDVHGPQKCRLHDDIIMQCEKDGAPQEMGEPTGVRFSLAEVLKLTDKQLFEQMNGKQLDSIRDAADEYDEYGTPWDEAVGICAQNWFPETLEVLLHEVQGLHLAWLRGDVIAHYEQKGAPQEVKHRSGVPCLCRVGCLAWTVKQLLEQKHGKQLDSTRDIAAEYDEDDTLWVEAVGTCSQDRLSEKFDVLLDDVHGPQKCRLHDDIIMQCEKDGAPQEMGEPTGVRFSLAEVLKLTDKQLFEQMNGKQLDSIRDAADEYDEYGTPWDEAVGICPQDRLWKRFDVSLGDVQGPQIPDAR